jgi:hypothetical protein
VSNGGIGNREPGGRKDGENNDSEDTDTEERDSTGSRNSKSGSGNRRRKGKNKHKGNGQGDGESNFNIKNGMVWNYDGSNTEHNHDSSRVQLDILKDPRYFHFSNEFGVGFSDDGGVSFPKLTDFKFN